MKDLLRAWWSGVATDKLRVRAWWFLAGAIFGMTAMYGAWLVIE